MLLKTLFIDHFKDHTLLLIIYVCILMSIYPLESVLLSRLFSKLFDSVNKSKNLKDRKKLLLNNAIRNNDTNVASAWSNLQLSKSLLDSVLLQVKAAEIANEGITVEYESGLGRSTLDIIQSYSLLLASKISLAESERNYLLSEFKLLQSVGNLRNNYLKLQ